MVCDFCKKRNAVFYIEQITKTNRLTIHVCAQCAVEKGLTPNSKDSRKSLNSLFNEINRVADKASKSDKCCPICGCGLSEIKKTGKVGCPECYAIFAEDIIKLMKSHGIKGPYTGSLPRRIAGFRSRLTDRMDIRTKLEESLKKEDYEKAAVYRDFLKALDRNSVSGEADLGVKNSESCDD